MVQSQTLWGHWRADVIMDSHITLLSYRGWAQVCKMSVFKLTWSATLLPLWHVPFWPLSAFPLAAPSPGWPDLDPSKHLKPPVTSETQTPP